MRREPLREAARMQRAAAHQGFDWSKSRLHRVALWDKLAEEIRELRAVAHDPQKAEEELGDLLFMVVNLSRHLGVDAPRALAAATRKFLRRYRYILRHEHRLPPLGDRRRLVAMEQFWQEAKHKEKVKKTGSRRERKGRKEKQKKSDSERS